MDLYPSYEFDYEGAWQSSIHVPSAHISPSFPWGFFKFKIIPLFPHLFLLFFSYLLCRPKYSQFRLFKDVLQLVTFLLFIFPSVFWDCLSTLPIFSCVNHWHAINPILRIFHLRLCTFHLYNFNLLYFFFVCLTSKHVECVLVSF